MPAIQSQSATNGRSLASSQVALQTELEYPHPKLRPLPMPEQESLMMAAIIAAGNYLLAATSLLANFGALYETER